MYRAYISSLRYLSSKILQSFKMSLKLRLGFSILLGLIVISWLGLRLSPYDPMSIGTARPNRPPSLSHPLGTDNVGRDELTLLFLASLNSLYIGFLTSIIGIMVAIFIGFISAYYGGTIDTILRTLTDIFITIPSLPILIAVAVYVRKFELYMMAILLSTFSWAWPARQIRSQVLSLKERPFIDLARVSGLRDIEIVIKELVPNLFQYISINFFKIALWAILAEVGLEILGLGPQYTATLGIMIYWALNEYALIRGFWWEFSPVIIIILVLGSFYLIHLGLDEIANPRLKKITGI